MILLLLFPGIAHKGTDYGIQLFSNALLPYLLSFIVLTGWLSYLTTGWDTNKLLVYFKIYIISAFGDFPTGTFAVPSYYKKIF